AITLPAHPFLLINNVKELYRNRSSVPQVRVAASQRRTPSVEAGYRALTTTCKYLFEEKCTKNSKKRISP
ncbi:MAG: hypothetical protein KTR23_19525, partial [Rhodospirillales bacterium]|nr:hypothetical protein [Rhodospirillales bacterium]